jgi:hypothetical protein
VVESAKEAGKLQIEELDAVVLQPLHHSFGSKCLRLNSAIN